MDIALNDGKTVSRDELNQHIIELYNTFNKLRTHNIDHKNKELLSVEEVRRF